jgi:L-fuconate dehydratase
VGLCEYVQHLCIFDYICVSQSLEDRFTEWADHLHEHFIDRPIVKNAHYMAPQAPGYSAEMKRESIANYEYPNGCVWKELRASKNNNEQ